MRAASRSTAIEQTHGGWASASASAATSWRSSPWHDGGCLTELPSSVGGGQPLHHARTSRRSCTLSSTTSASCPSTTSSWRSMAPRRLSTARAVATPSRPSSTPRRLSIASTAPSFAPLLAAASPSRRSKACKRLSASCAKAFTTESLGGSASSLPNASSLSSTTPKRSSTALSRFAAASSAAATAATEFSASCACIKPS
mmetsp:Transcript_21721/g.60685  ORF Transcript_21721/g.60685 Transcript_21721/m.60685 type:complete len:200 (+) Transcript_21721:249-848(+)